MKTKLNLYLIIFLTLLTLLSGCSQIKQSRSTSPYYDGVIKFNNQTIDNAKIMLSTIPGDKQCQQARIFTSTNSQGLFSLKAATEEYTYTPFVNYELDEWTVCALYNRTIYTLHNDNRYGSGNVSGSVFLDCDLAKASSSCNTEH